MQGTLCGPLMAILQTHRSAPPPGSLAHLKDQMVFLHVKIDNQLFVNSVFKSGAEIKMTIAICGLYSERKSLL